MRKILFVAIAAVMVCGCVNNDCSEMLPVRELFGAKFDEPWGGELMLNDLGCGGVDDVSEWQDLEQSYVVWTNDVLLSRFCGRAIIIAIPHVTEWKTQGVEDHLTGKTPGGCR